ncbi:hydrolase 1, exosortase A system-associated [Massilia sp. IC2-476]|uniref:hydrolase 1, exosortase A system-associated n=1 Tax=Massilia sp. IC2-476 TaxID=2887199 RepID=UPI001D118D49|nr:hydrolase 1, exosortase A system-associated [Massilia sp. IC2-476]MCC2973035.1 hydrolase 1, exosortase A system-associated [Massilia sp. IC2-476]
MIDERAISFDCEGDRLYGIVSLPAGPAAPVRGVLIVVGGPQYRAGSHRQFTLLARSLAARGIAAMRFDYRGMGDSEGRARGFEEVDADIRVALDAFTAAAPQLRDIALWGLCDGASAIAFYGAGDARVGGLALLNPWVRTEAGAARATIRHYYRRRLFEGELWSKILAGRFDLRSAAASALAVARSALGAKPAPGPVATLPQRMADGLARFDGRLLVMLSGADLTAQEFAGVAETDPAWRRLLGERRVTLRRLPGADHTCSRRDWHDQVVDWTCDWMAAW